MEPEEGSARLSAKDIEEDINDLGIFLSKNPYITAYVYNFLDDDTKLIIDDIKKKKENKKLRTFLAENPYIKDYIYSLLDDRTRILINNMTDFLKKRPINIPDRYWFEVFLIERNIRGETDQDKIDLAYLKFENLYAKSLPSDYVVELMFKYNVTAAISKLIKNKYDFNKNLKILIRRKQYKTLNELFRNGFKPLPKTINDVYTGEDYTILNMLKKYKIYPSPEILDPFIENRDMQNIEKFIFEENTMPNNNNLLLAAKLDHVDIVDFFINNFDFTANTLQLAANVAQQNEATDTLNYLKEKGFRPKVTSKVNRFASFARRNASESEEEEIIPEEEIEPEYYIDKYDEDEEEEIIIKPRENNDYDYEYDNNYDRYDEFLDEYGSGGEYDEYW